jgi:general secretion pathway protein D
MTERNKMAKERREALGLTRLEAASPKGGLRAASRAGCGRTQQVASLPARAVLAALLALLAAWPAAAQAPTPQEAARARIAALREQRAREAAERGGGPAARGMTPVSDEDHGGMEAAGTNEDGEELYTLNLRDAPLDLLLDNYSRMTGRTMLKAPGVNGTFTFKAYVSNGRSELTRAEMIQAMDSLLTMNNLALVPLGTRFYRVVQIANAPSEGLVISKEELATKDMESDALMRLLITVKYLDMDDAVNLVQPMLHGFGKLQRQDRIGGMIVTETAANLKTILDVLSMVDQPTELNVETRVYQIKHAKAGDIAARLNELVSDSQGDKKEEAPRVARPILRRAPDMTRARQPVVSEDDSSSRGNNADAAAEAAQKGIIRGKVKILTDERTNIIIVISNPLNFTFFDQIVNVLDVEVDPEIAVEVVGLEFADAEEMASLLNDFIGSAKSENESGAGAASSRDGEGGNARSRALSDLAAQRASASDRVRAAVNEVGATKIGQLSANTKILADKRINAILLMGTKGDIATLQDVIKKVDIMLAQVLIEAVILEVNLNNSTAYGVNWLQKSMTAYNQKLAGNGQTVRTPVVSWGGSFGNNTFATTAGENVTRAFAGGSGLTYLFSFADLNIDAVLSMVASSGEGRVLATPVVLTTDNTEASIMSGQQVPIRTGDTTSSGGTYYSDYEYKDVGIQLKVKPRINPSRYVTLEITQAADTLGDPVDVGNGNTMYSINKREMTASISVPSRSTIVLGGLVQTSSSKSQSRVPILGSLPLIGGLFRNSDKSNNRTELLVLITPYVLMTPEEARAETRRLHEASNVSAEDWYRGWSDSDLAHWQPGDPRAKDEKKAADLKARRDAQWKRAALRAAEEAGTEAVWENPEATEKQEGQEDAEFSEEELSELPVAVLGPDDDLPFADGEGGGDLERLMNSVVEPGGEGGAPVLEEAPALPLPGDATGTAPYRFDPDAASAETAADAAAEEPPPEPKKRRWALFGGGGKKKKSAPKEDMPSMFPAPKAGEGEG